MTKQERTLYARFNTARYHYVYDTYSNAILRTPPSLWAHLDDIISPSSSSEPHNDKRDCQRRAEIAIDAARAAGFLRPCRPTRMAFYADDQTLGTRVTNAIPQLTLELTERCNFRCQYCAFANDQQRNRQPGQMAIGTAQKAIDLFLEHSGAASRRTLSFWGGEPLLAFPLMRDIVIDVNKRARDKPVTYAFTTNASLITDSIATFLATNRFELLVSLDGPKHIHDKYRQRASGRGTFDDTVAGLRRLRSADAKFYEGVRFNCVIARDTSVSELLNFFDTDELVRGHHVSFSPANPAGLATTTWVAQHFGGLAHGQMQDARTAFVTSRSQSSSRRSAGAELFARRLQTIALRPRTPLTDTVQPNGCCVPLLRRIVVSVDGDVYMCERAPYRNRLGNVNSGFDFEQPINVVREYVARSLPECSQCWAMRLCTACYRDAMSDCHWDPADRKGGCERRRQRILADLAEYTSLYEDSPSAFDYLKDLEFSFPV